MDPRYQVQQNMIIIRKQNKLKVPDCPFPLLVAEQI